MRDNKLSKQILQESEERYKTMKVEFEINAPVFSDEKMEDYLRLFAKWLFVADGETVVKLTIDGRAINPYDKWKLVWTAYGFLQVG